MDILQYCPSSKEVNYIATIFTVTPHTLNNLQFNNKWQVHIMKMTDETNCYQEVLQPSQILDISDLKQCRHLCEASFLSETQDVSAPWLKTLTVAQERDVVSGASVVCPIIHLTSSQEVLHHHNNVRTTHGSLSAVNRVCFLSVEQMTNAAFLYSGQSQLDILKMFYRHSSHQLEKIPKQLACAGRGQEMWRQKKRGQHNLSSCMLSVEL